jgi:hypothetical protein
MESDSKKIKSTTESARNTLWNAIKSFDYPLVPKKNPNLRKDGQVSIISNLFPVEYIDALHKIILYFVEILPTVSDDNYPLKRIIHQHIESLLPEEFKKTFYAGNNLYACVTNTKNKDLTPIELTTSVNETEYAIKLKKVKEINFRDLTKNNDKENQEIKQMIEKLYYFLKYLIYLLLPLLLYYQLIFLN